MSMQELEVIGKKKQPLQKLNWKHQRVLDVLIERPDIKQKDLAVELGMSVSWLSTIMGTDLFRAELSRRRELLVEAKNAALVDSLQDNVSRGVSRMGRIVDNDESSDATAVNATKTMLAALGMGGRNTTTTTNNTTNNTQVNAENAALSVNGVSAEMLAQARARRES